MFIKAISLECVCGLRFRQKMGRFADSADESLSVPSSDGCNLDCPVNKPDNRFQFLEGGVSGSCADAV